MDKFDTQELKDEAIERQQEIVDKATPDTLAAEKGKLADLKSRGVK